MLFGSAARGLVRPRFDLVTRIGRLGYFDRFGEAGFERFAFVLFPPPSDPSPPLVLTNFPDPYVDGYFDRRSYRNDVVIRRSQLSLSPEPWGTGEWRSSLGRRNWRHYEEQLDWNLRHGVAIGFRGPLGHRGILCLTTGVDETRFRRRIDAGRRTLLLVTPQMADLILAEAASAGPPPPLSPRQAEVLAAMSRGATIAAAASQLAMTERTVRHHLEEARRKLGADTIAAAVAAAVERGAI